MARRWRAWIADRFALEPAFKQLLDRRVPKSSWYHGDGSTMVFLLMIQIVTGAFMMLTYSPHPDGAYQSVQYITTEQTLGWLLRGMHYWSAGLMMVLLFFHLLRQILLAGYKSSREATWLIGVLMFFCVLILSFTGYLLRWDERAIYGIRVVLHMFYRVPLIGEHLVLLVQGGPDIGAQTLTRIYAVHVIIVPLMLLGLLAIHLYLVVVHGVTFKSERQQPIHSAREHKELYARDKQSGDKGETFHPDSTLKLTVWSAVALIVVLSLAVFVGPRELQPEGNLVADAFPAEEWWYWWVSSLLALTPPALQPYVVVGLPILVFLVLVLLPFVDRNPHRSLRRRPVAVTVVVLVALALITLTAMRPNSPWTGWPDPEPPPVPEGATLTEAAEQGRQLYVEFGCTSCHAIAGHGRQVGTDLARLADRYSHEELRGYILNPPPEVAMPAYEGRLTDEQLDRIVEFVMVAQTFGRALD